MLYILCTGLGGGFARAAREGHLELMAAVQATEVGNNFDPKRC